MTSLTTPAPPPRTAVVPHAVPGARGRTRRAARTAAGVLLGALVIALAALAGAAALGVAPHVELSDSMRPLLRAGDVVWLERIAARDARPGDVVAFDGPARDTVVLHRVEHVRPAPLGRLAFRTRGDANNTSEGWRIAAGGTIGRYAGVRLPHAGRAVRALQGPPLAILAVVSGAMLAALALRRIWA